MKSFGIPPQEIAIGATAAVTEEILYRGFAIGIGKAFLGNTLEAATLSVVIFTVTHFRWGFSHMLSVLSRAVD
jgi:membrane protease YdiL (CAAX protease family)